MLAPRATIWCVCIGRNRARRWSRLRWAYATGLSRSATRPELCRLRAPRCPDGAANGCFGTDFTNDLGGSRVSVPDTKNPGGQPRSALASTGGSCRRPLSNSALTVSPGRQHQATVTPYMMCWFAGSTCLTRPQPFADLRSAASVGPLARRRSSGLCSVRLGTFPSVLLRMVSVILRADVCESERRHREQNAG